MTERHELSRLTPFSLLEEPQLTFDSSDKALDVNPLRGLDRHGPYSSGSFKTYTKELRVATIAPESGWAGLRLLVGTLRSSHSAKDRVEYVPAYRGFEQIFGIPLVAAATSRAHIKLPDDIGLKSAANPGAQLMQVIGGAMDRLAIEREHFDVVLIHLPDAWQSAFRAPGFDAHDAIKALGAGFGIPSQVINDRAIQFTLKASLAWRLGIALYVKAGGIPWKLGPLPGVPEGTAYIGLAYALRGDQAEAHHVTCCSQVFDADGGGMQFVAFQARDPVQDLIEAKRNPFLSRSDMRSVLARSLSLYTSRSGGQLPKRLVVHKTTAFKPDELSGVLDATAAIPELECVEVGSAAGWRGVWLLEGKGNVRSTPDGFPVPRGAVLQRTGKSALVWVAGNAPRAALRGDYYQGKKSIPRPLSLVRHAGKGPLQLSALEALALTKMDWNNDALYDPVPVTIRYSQRLARTIANVPNLPGNAYAYRLFM